LNTQRVNSFLDGLYEHKEVAAILTQ